MVSEEVFEERDSFVCEVCGFHYERHEQAERCERFCRENNACNPAIIADALENTKE